MKQYVDIPWGRLIRVVPPDECLARAIATTERDIERRKPSPRWWRLKVLLKRLKQEEVRHGEEGKDIQDGQKH